MLVESQRETLCGLLVGFGFPHSRSLASETTAGLRVYVSKEEIYGAGATGYLHTPHEAIIAEEVG